MEPIKKTTTQDYQHQVSQSHQHLSAEQLIKLIRQNNEAKKLDFCMALIQLLLKLKPKIDRELQEQIGSIEETYTKCERCLKYFDERIEDWNSHKIDDKNMLCTKIIHKSEVLVRFDGQVKINVENLCSMIYELSLYKDWVPFVKESKDLKTPTKASKIGYLKFSLPFISDREGFFYGQGIDRINSHGKILVYCQAITGNKAAEKRYGLPLQKNEKSVELDLKFFILELTMLDFGLYGIRCFAHLDIKMSFIPQFVLNFFTKKIGAFLMEKMIKLASDLKGTEWQKKIKSQQDSFYPWLKEKIANWEKIFKESKEGSEKPARLM